MDHTPILGLPLIHSGQAQKEITHNEALLLLDVLINPVVQAIDARYPPEDAELGQLFIIAANPAEEFANHQHELALKLEHGWRFIAPRKWLEITVDADGSKYCWNGEYWLPVARTT